MKPIAILCSDLHLSLKQPACRADKDWKRTQAYYLGQLKGLARGPGFVKGPGDKPLPVICSGDLFDKWNAPPELINFALEHLPDGMICVPGNHDLPNHRIEEIHRSGYGVLLAAGKIIDLSSEKYVGPDGDFVAHGYSCSKEVVPFNPGWECSKMPRTVHLAVIHQYMWLGEESKYPGAPEESSFAANKKILKTYDAVCIGDNHKGWTTNYPGTSVFNAGTFIRRKSDEIQYRPTVGILMDDGTIKRHYLDTSIDKFHENPKQREETEFNMKEFIEGLEGLGEHGLDFRAAIENHLRTEDLDKETKAIILQALETDNKSQ